MIVNRWNLSSRNRASPDYYQSFGLGFFEYFQLCRRHRRRTTADSQLRHGLSIQHGRVGSAGGIEPYIEDALDLIEFANGPVDQRLGGRRAAMGHPEQFNLKKIGVGNEQWGPNTSSATWYSKRPSSEKYPDIKLMLERRPEFPQRSTSRGSEIRAAASSCRLRRRALLSAARLVPQERRSLRHLPAHRAENPFVIQYCYE